MHRATRKGKTMTRKAIAIIREMATIKAADIDATIKATVLAELTAELKAAYQPSTQQQLPLEVERTEAKKAK